MKKILTILLLTVSTISYSQEDSLENPYKFLLIQNENLIFEKVFPVDTLKLDQIESKLIPFLATLPGVSNVVRTASGVITCNISNAKIDFKKYGGTSLGVSIFIQSPFFGDVVVLVKDGKYKIAVTNMYFDIPNGYGSITKYTSTDAFLKSSPKEFRSMGSIIRSGGYLESHLTEMFTLKT